MRFLSLLSLVFCAAVQAETARPSPESARPAPETVLPPEEEGQNSPHGEAPDVAVARRQAHVVSLFRALEQTLAPVADKASADAAAPAVLQLTCDLRRVQVERHRTSERGSEAEKAMDDWNLRHGKAFALLTGKSFGKALDLLLDAPSCHGSSALEGALLQLFDVLEEREPEDSSAT